MEEPSILDYLKSKLNPRRHPPITIPRPEAIGQLEAPENLDQQIFEDQEY